MLSRRLALLALFVAICVAFAHAQGGLRVENAENGTATATPLPFSPPVPFIPVPSPSPSPSPTSSWIGREIAGALLSALVVSLASIGGVGGGSVLTPLLVLVMALSPKTVVPLTSITVVGATAANLVLNVRKSRRNSNEPLIDWDLVLCLQPMLLMGSGFGMFLGSVCPPTMLFILLLILLFYVGKIAITRALQEMRRERWGWMRNSSASARLIGAGPGYNASTTVERNAAVPWKKLGMLLGLYVGFVGFSLIFGGGNYPSIIGISPNSFLGAIAGFFPVVFLWCFSSYAFQNVINTFQRQQNPRYILSADEIQWSPRSVQFLPFIALAAGTTSGVFGFLGGIVNGPLLLKLGVEPSAAASITAVTVLFSSGMATFGDVMMHALDWQLALVLLPVGFIATLAGQVLLERLMQRYACPSLVIFSMATIIVLTALLTITLFVV